jgi:hypothetical protein
MRTVEIIAILKDVRKCATMVDANFGEDTDMIRDKTKLWRNTWIISGIDEALKLLEG